ncbi:AAA family ATPase [Corynebacterium sp. AOP40-9SA-29]|uniref:AAA family ATPase n=1 Tax=Corynebacterium sp. AOP40-9SA-29 TaxID=3457677 RepID=UPI004033F0F5
MLLSLTIENYRSFADPAVLDLQKRAFTTNLPKTGEWRDNTERIAGLYGPNASGKTTVLMALEALRRAVAESVQSSRSAQLLRTPHALRKERATFFEVEYVRDGIRFRWSVTLTGEGIEDEHLEAVGGEGGSSHWRRLYTRTGASIEFGRHSGLSKAAQQNIEAFLRPWTLVLSAWSLVRDPGPYFPAVTWWTECLAVAPAPGSGPESTEAHTELLKLMVDPGWRTAAHAVLRAADIGVTSVDIRKDKMPQELVELLESVQEVLHSKRAGTSTDAGVIDQDPRLAEKVNDVIRRLEFTHSATAGDFLLKEQDESRGTRFWLDLALTAVRSLVTGEVLVIDELDASMHPALVRYFIDLFLDETTNPSGAQLVYTSHEVTPLGNTLSEHLPPSVVWLVEKVDAESSLTCLDEFRIGQRSNLEKQYLGGAFGALPVIGDELSSTIGELRRQWVAEQP